jgi:hypothetical protein
VRNGRAYRRPMWAPAIEGIGGGVLPIGPDGTPGLPTPSACVANDGERPETWLARRERVKLTANNSNGMGMPLTIAAQLLPTPKAGDGERGRDKARARPDTKGRELATVVRDQMLPTPRACSAMAARLDTTGNLEGERFPNLETVMAQQLLTPTATDWKGRTNWQAAGRNGPQRLPGLIPTGEATYLNPSFVEEMMGFPVGWTA